MKTATPRRPPNTPRTTREWWVTLVLLIAIIAATVVAVVVSKPHLPDPMATHFGGFANSPPDGFSSRAGNLVAIPLIVAALCVVTGIVWFVSTSFAVRRWVVVGGAGMSALIFAVLLSIIEANYDLSDAHHARMDILVGLVPIVGAVILGAIALLAYGRVLESERTPPTVENDRPMVEVSRTERVSWSHRGHSDLLIAIGIIVTLVPLALVAAGLHSSLLIAVVAGLFALQFAFYNTRITNDKIVVRSGAISYPDDLARHERRRVRRLRGRDLTYPLWRLGSAVASKWPQPNPQ